MNATVEVPRRMGRLPIDKHGRPVPWFTAWVDGEPDFRIAREEALRDALRFELCWVCGQRRGRWGSFVIGPMCAVNRVTAEPPCHRECAEYSARACPFLTVPGMRRRDTSNVPGRKDPAGIAIMRNPGVVVVWTSRNWDYFNPGPPVPGIMFNVGDPGEDPTWWHRGRPASRAEVMESIRTGLPALADVAAASGPVALQALTEDVAIALVHLPPDDPQPEHERVALSEVLKFHPAPPTPGALTTRA